MYYTKLSIIILFAVIGLAQSTQLASTIKTKYGFGENMIHISEIEENFFEAYAVCRAQGGYIMYPETEDELDLINFLITKNEKNRSSTGLDDVQLRKYWIGLIKEYEEYHIPFDYYTSPQTPYVSNWHYEFLRKDLNGYHHFNCIEVRSNDNNKWHQSYCGDKKLFFCNVPIDHCELCKLG